MTTNDTCLLGIDVGTTACKAVIADLQGRVLSSGTAVYPIYTPHPSWMEEDPEEVWAGMVAAVRQAVADNPLGPSSIRALSFSGVLHSMVPVDREWRPLTRALTWGDRRSISLAARIRHETDPHRLYLRTGCPIHPMYLPAKIAWFREERTEVHRQAYKYLSIKDYILHKLCGECLGDISIASGSGLMNTHQLCWDAEALELAGISEEKLPPLVSPETVLEGIAPEWAEAMGLPVDIPIVVGAADGGLANLGTGTVAAGQMTSTIGSSGAVRLITHAPRFDEQERTWCYVLTEGTWFVGGAINNGGIVYQWFRDKFCREEIEQAKLMGREAYDLLNAYAEEVGLGAEGLIFLPYLTGERNPYWNANARGVLFGLSLHHSRKHIARAIMEGVAFRMYSIFQALEELSGGVREIRASGGFTRSELWVQILADVYGHPIVTTVAKESSSMGAIFLAMKALGYIDSLEEAGPLVPLQTVFEPDMRNHEAYLRLYELFHTLYWDLTDRFDTLSALWEGE